MSHTGHVLVVDDQKINLRLLVALLEPLGYRVTQANNGPEALAKVREDPPDVVLLDIMMPGMDGYEVVRRLKADSLYRHIPVVMVTALKEVDDRVMALEAGADDFLSKPVDKTELRARVGSLMQVKAYHDHLLVYQKELEAAVARRTEQLSQALAEVRRASLDTIHRLSMAAEYKDEDTGDHIQRMSNFAAAMAQELGLGDKTAQAILYAAPMHDVGKIGIPDNILLKPGPLDAEEWEIMKTHTVIGANILAGGSRGFLRLGQVIALTHHERWDGSGYPQGLKGRQIPLAGQIVAVCDVFDALTSRRPYKEPFTVERSLEIMREGRGAHFNPRVLDAFLGILDQILDIKARYHPPERADLDPMAHWRRLDGLPMFR